MSDNVNTISPNKFIEKSRVVSFLKMKEAFDISSAHSLDELKNKNLLMQIAFLIEEGVVVYTSEGRYYILKNSLENLDAQYKKSRVVSYLIRKEAFDKSSAHSLGELKNKSLIRLIAILIEEGVIAHTKDGHYFILVDSLDSFETQRKKFFFMLIVSIVIPAVIFLLLGIAWILTAT